MKRESGCKLFSLRTFPLVRELPFSIFDFYYSLAAEWPGVPGILQVSCRRLSNRDLFSFAEKAVRGTRKLASVSG